MGRQAYERGKAEYERVKAEVLTRYQQAKDAEVGELPDAVQVAGTDEAPSVGKPPSVHTPQELQAETILVEEFRFAAMLAMRAMEGRDQTLNMYLLVVGGAASAVGALYQIDPVHFGTQPLVAVVLAVAALASFTLYTRLVRLRGAYRESLVTMNTIKEYYLSQLTQAMPDLPRAFRWRLFDLSSGESVGSATLLVCLLAAIVGGILAGGAAALASALWILGVQAPGAGWWQGQPLVIGVGAGLVVLLMQLMYLWIVLGGSSERARRLLRLRRRNPTSTIDHVMIRQ